MSVFSVYKYIHTKTLCFYKINPIPQSNKVFETQILERCEKHKEDAVNLYSCIVYRYIFEVNKKLNNKNQLRVIIHTKKQNPPYNNV